MLAGGFFGFKQIKGNTFPWHVVQCFSSTSFIHLKCLRYIFERGSLTQLFCDPSRKTFPIQAFKMCTINIYVFFYFRIQFSSGLYSWYQDRCKKKECMHFGIEKFSWSKWSLLFQPKPKPFSWTKTYKIGTYIQNFVSSFCNWNECHKE